jgi:multicomponent Na+:H+ antiporter subunit D
VNLLPVLPILIPLFAAILHLVLPQRNSAAWRAVMNLVGSVALFVVALYLWSVTLTEGVQVTRLGNWPSPYGIVFVSDLFSALMIVAASFIAVCVSIYCFADTGARASRLGYFAAFQTLLMGVCGAFLSGDLFNLFVWFEVMLISSFVLMAFEGRQIQLEGALKYTILNLIASIFFLTATGIVYGEAGTLNLADLSRLLRDQDLSPGMMAGFALLLLAFGAKAGVFPLFFWMPASYHTPAFATSALFAGLLTKVGVYALIRICTLIFPLGDGLSRPMLLVVAGLTMMIGVLGAAAQMEFRRLLSFHSVSQIGFMVLALAFFTPAAIAASILYVLHHMIVKSNLFLIGGLIARRRGNLNLKKIGGLYKEVPFLGALFLIPALSLAGLPPFSGFFAKLSVLRAGLQTEQYVLVAVALVVGFFTLFSMVKVWNEAFWKPTPRAERSFEPHEMPVSMIAPVVLMVVATIWIGVWPEPLLASVERIAEELLGQSAYVDAVLGRE